MASALHVLRQWPPQLVLQPPEACQVLVVLVSRVIASTPTAGEEGMAAAAVAVAKLRRNFNCMLVVVLLAG